MTTQDDQVTDHFRRCPTPWINVHIHPWFVLDSSQHDAIQIKTNRLSHEELCEVSKEIVRRVNAHDGLVEALRSAYRWLDTYGTVYDPGDPRSAQQQEVFDRMVSALNAAGVTP